MSTLPSTNGSTWGKEFYFFEPPFPYCQNGNAYETHLKGPSQGLKEIIPANVHTEKTEVTLGPLLLLMF